MGRVFKTTIDNVSIGTAVQDIVSLKASANNAIFIHSIHIDSTNTAAASLRLRLKRGVASLGGSSGGTNQTPSAANSADQGNHLSTSHINDTTQATATTFYTLCAWNPDLVMPFEYIPPPEDRDSCKPGEILVLDLPAVIVATTISATVVWEETP